jgi:hypothetical protein
MIMRAETHFDRLFEVPETIASQDGLADGRSRRINESSSHNRPKQEKTVHGHKLPEEKEAAAHGLWRD